MKFPIFFFAAWIFAIACNPENSSQTPSSPELSPAFFSFQVQIDSLAHPWSMAFLSEEEVLISEKDGVLKRIELPSKRVFSIAGLPEDRFQHIRQEDPRDNSGLFEIVLDPDFPENQWIYLSYAAQDEKGTGLKVIRAIFHEDSLQDIQPILVVKPFRRDWFHYGGGMTFGADGMLYITAGERYYNEIDQPKVPVAQDPADMRGKIYRIHPDGRIPKDNPDFGPGTLPGCYAMGIRAAQGIIQRPQSEEIWFTEHGSRQGDEINLLLPGANYGWPIETTGTYRNEDYQPPKSPGDTFTPPKWSWDQTVAPTGLCFYTGEAFPQWKGHLFVAGLSKGSLWKIQFSEHAPSSAENLMQENPVRLRKVVQSPKGKLFLLTDEANGKLIQLTPGE